MYHELTVWSRGIVMDSEARDVSSCIAAASRALGYNAESVSYYVDDPDWMNCLARGHARFGGQSIADRFVYLSPEMQAHDRFLASAVTGKVHRGIRSSVSRLAR